MTMTRAGPMEMTEDWVHTRITEHDKALHLVGRKSPPEKKQGTPILRVS